MKLWYYDKNLSIYFDKNPDCDIRKILPTTKQIEIDNIEKKPLILNNTIFCLIFYKNKNYSFNIEHDYIWDGASIPSFAWIIIGSKLDPQFMIASLIHDYLCENHYIIENNRYLSTLIFVALLSVAKVNPLKRLTMKYSIDIWQKLIIKW